MRSQVWKRWEKHSWQYLSFDGDDRIINLEEEDRMDHIFSKLHRNFDGVNGEPMEFEWNIFPGFDTLQLRGGVKDLQI